MKVDDPAAVGVPDIPPPLLSVKPGGRAPADTLQLYGDVPPVADAEELYAVPTVPFGSEVVVIEIGAVPVAIETVYACEPAPPPESNTCSVNVNEPAVVGVPEIPPRVLNIKPGGSTPPVKFQPYGASPPLAATLAIYGTPAFPLGSEVVVMARSPVMAIEADDLTCWPEASDA